MPMNPRRWWLVLSAVPLIAAGAALIGHVKQVPLRFLIRSTPHEFKQEDIDQFLGQRIPNAKGYLVAVAGMGAYFSGESSRSFYIGSDSSWNGKILIQSTQDTALPFKARILLNHRQIPFRSAKVGSGKAVWFVQGVLAPLQKTEIDVGVEGIAAGRNDLQVLVKDETPKTGPCLEAKIFEPVNVSRLMVVRGASLETAAFRTDPDGTMRSAPKPCQGHGTDFRIGPDGLEVRNCTEGELNGVFIYYGDGPADALPPTYYHAAPFSKTTLKARNGGNPEGVLHLPCPYCPLETPWGRQDYSWPIVEGV